MFAVEVDVALARPPRADATVRVLVDAESVHEAELVACQIAACDRRVVMPVGARLIPCRSHVDTSPDARIVVPMTTTTNTGLTDAPEYGILYVSCYRRFDDGQPSSIGADLLLQADVEGARTLAAQFPKSTKVRALSLTHSSTSGRPVDGFLKFSAQLAADGVNGGRNETGIRRFKSLLKAAEKLGLTVEFVQSSSHMLSEAEIMEATR